MKLRQRNGTVGVRGSSTHPAVLIAFALALLAGCTHRAKQEDVAKRITAETQELFDAVAPGNKAPWQQYIAEDVMYFDERGNNMDKKALLATINPLPAGVTGKIKVVNSKFNIQDTTLIYSYDLDESENVYGQELHARYHATDTWWERNGRWQMVAGQVFRYYEDPARVTIDTRKLRDYVGTYELAGMRTVISLADGRLYLQRGTRPAAQLIPEACDIFFRRGIEGRILFRHTNGNIDALIDRRNNEDIVWIRAK